MSKKSVIEGTLLFIVVIVLCVVCLNGCGSNLELPEIEVTPIQTVVIGVMPKETVVEIVTTAAVNDFIFTHEEIDLLGRLIMSESGKLPLTGKIAVLATVVNRVNSDKFPDTIYEVANQYTITKDGKKIYQYSLADNGEPTDECCEAIEAFELNMFPDDMFYFRTDHPHSFGYFYIQIGNTYFSTESDHGNQN